MNGADIELISMAGFTLTALNLQNGVREGVGGIYKRMIPFKRYHRIGLMSTVQSTTVEMRSILYNWSSITEILALYARVQSYVLN